VTSVAITISVPSFYSAVRFHVLMAASMNTIACWEIAPCNILVVDRRFRGVYYLHYQGDGWRQYAPLKRRSTTRRLHGAIPQKVIIFLLGWFTLQVLEGKPEGKRPLGRPRRRWEVGI
jgi:hypothetical protein